jgi:hypothetical protein
MLGGDIVMLVRFIAGRAREVQVKSWFPGRGASPLSVSPTKNSCKITARPCSTHQAGV